LPRGFGATRTLIITTMATVCIVGISNPTLLSTTLDTKATLTTLDIRTTLVTLASTRATLTILASSRGTLTILLTLLSLWITLMK